MVKPKKIIKRYTKSLCNRLSSKNDFQTKSDDENYPYLMETRQLNIKSCNKLIINPSYKFLNFKIELNHALLIKAKSGRNSQI